MNAQAPINWKVCKSREEWLAARMEVITSTEVSALFGHSPYTTEFELWHSKKNRVVEQIAENERMTWGKRLQGAIAQGVAEDRGWTDCEDLDMVFVTCPPYGIGTSLDFRVVCSEFGIGLLEIKNVDRFVYKNDWTEDGDAVLAPPHIELQLQHEMLCTGYEWGCIVALVGGNEIKVCRREADPTVHKAIKAKAEKFWDSIRYNRPPNPDFARDSEFIIKKLYRDADAAKTLHSIPGLDAQLDAYARASDAVKKAEEERDAWKARILMYIGDAGKVVSPLGSLTCTETKDNPGTLVTPDMVGTYINPRKGFRQFRFYPKKIK